MAVEDLALDGCAQRTLQQNEILAGRSDSNRAFLIFPQKPDPVPTFSKTG